MYLLRYCLVIFGFSRSFLFLRMYCNIHNTCFNVEELWIQMYTHLVIYKEVLPEMEDVWKIDKTSRILRDEDVPKTDFEGFSLVCALCWGIQCNVSPPMCCFVLCCYVVLLCCIVMLCCYVVLCCCVVLRCCVVVLFCCCIVLLYCCIYFVVVLCCCVFVLLCFCVVVLLCYNMCFNVEELWIQNVHPFSDI